MVLVLVQTKTQKWIQISNREEWLSTDKISIPAPNVTGLAIRSQQARPHQTSKKSNHVRFTMAAIMQGLVSFKRTHILSGFYFKKKSTNLFL